MQISSFRRWDSMSLNWREIDLVLSELDCVGSHIQQIIQPDYRNLYLYLFSPERREVMRICLATGATRIHATSVRPKKPHTRQRFEQFLTSRLKGGRITEARQVNRDRIVRLQVSRAGEITDLWIRLWGGAANIIATEPDGRVLDAFFRRPRRGESSGGQYLVEEDTDLSPEHEEKLSSFVNRFDPARSVSQQIDEHYRLIEEETERAALVEKTQRRVAQQRNAVAARLEKARNRLEATSAAEEHRHFGDLIIANLHRIAPGDKWLEAEDYATDNSIVSIELDPESSPQANAEKYYQKAKRAKKRVEGLSQEIANLERRLKELDARLDQVSEWSLEQLRSETLPSAKPQKRDETTPPGLEFTSYGYQILVGRTAAENDQLLRRHVRGNDLWLHTRDYPGGYVFVRSRRGKSVPLEVLLDAGNLAVHFSKARSNGGAELYYTPVKYLRRARSGPAGLVLPTQEKNLTIRVEPERIARLLG
jgi:predicted ribosome quality control (RQC) complex YloA/Tae2 family protein